MDRDTRRTGKHHPKDVPKMTEQQKEALCSVTGKHTDLYHDQRSLVQIWRDGGVRYDDHVMPPPAAPRAHNQHRRQLSGSRGSSVVDSSGPASARSSMSQALVPIGSPTPLRNNPVSSFTNSTYANGNSNGNYVNGSYANGNGANGNFAKGNYASSNTSSVNGSHFSNGFHSQFPSTFATQQHQTAVRPASRMGDPATAFFTPGQAGADNANPFVNGPTRYANGSNFNNNNHNGAFFQAPPAFGIPQQQQQQQQQAAVRPASRMGDPATACFVPGQASANTANTPTAAQATIGEGFRANNTNIDIGNILATGSNAEIEALIRHFLQNPDAMGNDLAKFYNTHKDNDGSQNGGDAGAGFLGHRRMNTR
ncbi:hypothetical protein SLS58_002505 [Diplodia intermedia]|uniref:Uncharacterized protein n=1 Tax=Diplodia intermedia TaxID=856260 RepID=A0ABR3TZJ7_9PEZI